MRGQGFAVGQFRDRVEVVVTGPWSGQVAELVVSGEVDRVVLNYALGFAERDLDFLRGLPVRQLVILDRRLTSLEPVHALSGSLELLHLTTDPALGIDLSQFTRLRELSADWQQIRSTVSSAASLERVHVGRYAERDLGPLTGLQNLRSLVLTDRPRLVSLAGLARFPSLRVLQVALARYLVDISELRSCKFVEEVQLESCRKLSSIEALASLANLRRLNLSECGDLASLAPIARLTDLEVVGLFGSTRIIDGDLTPLAALPRLKELRMQSRRHYRPTVDDVQAGLPTA